MQIVAEPAWDDLLQRLLSGKGTALFLGRSDSGKSTLIKYLLGQLSASGVPVALVDADVGQSSLGLPGTVSSRAFHSLCELQQFRWEKLSFLGSVTPAPILSLLAVETGRMVLRARQQAAVILVDTTGLVDGGLGRALKLAKIRAVSPEIVVAVAAGQELEPIMSGVPAVGTFRLTPSPLVQRRSPQVRICYRHARLLEYFHGARQQLLATRRLLFIRHGAPVHPLFSLPEPGRVLGLNHGAETRALGVVAEADSDSLAVFTPLASLRAIDRVVLGDYAFSCETSDCFHSGRRTTL